MRKRATAVLLPVALWLAACAPASDFTGEMPEFSETKDGATLRFGQVAKVVTEDVAHHVPVQWEVKVEKPKLIDAPRSAAQTKQFICFPVELTPVAVGVFSTDVTVALPELKPIDGSRYANLADPAYCAEAAEAADAAESADEAPARGSELAPLSGYTGDLVAGEPQRTYAASWVGTANPGIEGTGVELSTQDTSFSWR